MKLKITDTAKIHSVAKNLAELAFSMGVDIESILPTFQTLAEKELDERIKTVTISVKLNGVEKEKMTIKIGDTFAHIKEKAEWLLSLGNHNSYTYTPLNSIDFHT